MVEVKNNRPAAQEEDTIDLLQLAAALWENILIIIICAILGGALALGYSFFMITPQYSASTTLYVNTKNFSLGSTSISYSDLTTANRMVDIYIAILSSRETLQEVAEQAGIEYDYDELSEKIGAESGTADGIFEVTVTSSSPTEAELLANTVASVLPDRIADIVDGTSVKVVEYAVVPTHRSSPSYARNTMVGVLAGIVIACAVVVVLELVRSGRDTNIHSSDELRELYPDIPVLATVTDMRHTPKSGYYSSYYGSDSEESKNEEEKGEKAV